MNFDIDAKLFREVLRIASCCKSTKPNIMDLTIYVHDNMMIFSGVNNSMTLQSCVTLKKDFINVYDDSNSDTNEFSLCTETLIKMLGKIKGNVNVDMSETEVKIIGEGIKYIEKVPVDIQKPVIKIIFNDYVPFPETPSENIVKIKVNDVPDLPVTYETITINVDKDRATIISKDEVSETEILLSRDIKWLKDSDSISVTVSYESLKDIISLLKQSITIYVTEQYIYCLSTMEWGNCGFIVPVW